MLQVWLLLGALLLLPLQSAPFLSLVDVHMGPDRSLLLPPTPSRPAHPSALLACSTAHSQVETQSASALVLSLLFGAVGRCLCLHADKQAASFVLSKWPAVSSSLLTSSPASLASAHLQSLAWCPWLWPQSLVGSTQCLPPMYLPAVFQWAAFIGHAGLLLALFWLSPSVFCSCPSSYELWQACWV